MSQSRAYIKEFADARANVTKAQAEIDELINKIEGHRAVTEKLELGTAFPALVEEFGAEHKAGDLHVQIDELHSQLRQARALHLSSLTQVLMLSNEHDDLIQPGDEETQPKYFELRMAIHFKKIEILADNIKASILALTTHADKLKEDVLDSAMLMRVAQLESVISQLATRYKELLQDGVQFIEDYPACMPNEQNEVWRNYWIESGSKLYEQNRIFGRNEIFIHDMHQYFSALPSKRVRPSMGAPSIGKGGIRDGVTPLEERHLHPLPSPWVDYYDYSQGKINIETVGQTEVNKVYQALVAACSQAVVDAPAIEKLRREAVRKHKIYIKTLQEEVERVSAFIEVLKKNAPVLTPERGSLKPAFAEEKLSVDSVAKEADSQFRNRYQVILQRRQWVLPLKPEIHAAVLDAATKGRGKLNLQLGAKLSALGKYTEILDLFNRYMDGILKIEALIASANKSKQLRDKLACQAEITLLQKDIAAIPNQLQGLYAAVEMQYPGIYYADMRSSLTQVMTVYDQRMQAVVIPFTQSVKQAQFEQQMMENRRAPSPASPLRKLNTFRDAQQLKVAVAHEGKMQEHRAALQNRDGNQAQPARLIR